MSQLRGSVRLWRRCEVSRRSALSTSSHQLAGSVRPPTTAPEFRMTVAPSGTAVALSGTATVSPQPAPK